MLIPIVDLALLKNTTETGPFSYGDTVTFFIEVTNQGNVAANNVVVTDYIPAGFDYSDSSGDVWAGGTEGPVNVTHTIMDTLLAGETTTLDDIDSDADGINGNDAGGNATTDSDDVVDGDGTGDPTDIDPASDNHQSRKCTSDEYCSERLHSYRISVCG